MHRDRQWGVTPPVSLAASTPQEIAANVLLIEELKRQGTFGSSEELQKRQRVLSEIQNITRQFVHDVSLKKHMTEEMAREAGGKIFTFGSFRLGVFAPDADIDTLVVAPKHVTRDNFFNEFKELLSKQPLVTDVTGIPEAYVPILNFKYDGVEIDLSFASIHQPRVELDLDLTDNLLNGLDDATIKSINGTRVADQMLKLVPNPAVFKHALRAVKLWAARKGIHQNKVGFLGGVAWAILVARICQLYPTAVPAVILSKFFRILSSWPWPQPVQLNHIEDHNVLKVWNPKLYGGDRAHRMPVITPAYPAMCATHNVTESTQKVMIKQMQTAGGIVDQILLNKLPWSALFEKLSFFLAYKYYIVVTVASRTAEAQLRWSGAVLSKLRILVQKLEITESIALAHPYPKGINTVHYCSAEEEVRAVANGDRPQTVQIKQLDLAKTALKSQNGNAKVDSTEGLAETEVEGKITVYTSYYYIGLEIQQNPNVGRRLDLSWASQEFFEKCRSWEAYDDQGMNVCINVVRSYDLPDEVFEEGEMRPVRLAKSHKRKRGAGNDTMAAVSTTNGVYPSTLKAAAEEII